MHLEKSQLTVTPPVSGGKPIFSLAMKDEMKLFTYSFHRKVIFFRSFDIRICHQKSFLVVHLRSAIIDIDQ